MPSAKLLDRGALLLLGALPLAMALANRSAPAVLVAAALAALAARVADGTLDVVGRRIAATIRQPLAFACLAFLAIATASAAWSHDPRATVWMLGEFGISAVAPFLLHAALPRTLPRAALRWAAVAFGLGCTLMIAELATGLSLRRALGLRAETYIFKRSVASLLMVYWPLAALLWREGFRTASVALGTLLAAATIGAHAAAALVGFALGGLILALALGAKRATVALVITGLVAALALAPLVGEMAARALPARVLDSLRDSHARERIDIWLSFGEVARLRPLAGLGFGTSAATGRDPVAREVPEERRLMLDVGHPHSGYLQVWSETGALGAAVAALVLTLLVLRAGGAPAPVAAPGLAAVASGGAIMLMGHGAWQGWWIASIGAGTIWLAREIARGQPSLSGDSRAPPRNPVAST